MLTREDLYPIDESHAVRTHQIFEQAGGQVCEIIVAEWLVASSLDDAPARLGVSSREIADGPCGLHAGIAVLRALPAPARAKVDLQQIPDVVVDYRLKLM